MRSIFLHYTRWQLIVTFDSVTLVNIFRNEYKLCHIGVDLCSSSLNNGYFPGIFLHFVTSYLYDLATIWSQKKARQPFSREHFPFTYTLVFVVNEYVASCACFLYFIWLFELFKKKSRGVKLGYRGGGGTHLKRWYGYVRLSRTPSRFSRRSYPSCSMIQFFRPSLWTKITNFDFYAREIYQKFEEFSALNSQN